MGGGENFEPKYSTLKSEFINTLQETIKTECGYGPVYYIANHGNWGDGLIRQATLKFFQDIKLNFIELKGFRKANLLFPNQKIRHVIYGGGGAWCELWNHSVKIVRKLSKKFKVVVLPSTYDRKYTINNTIFFCRDRFESQQYMPEALFCHDMAFYIGKNSFPKTNGDGEGFFFRTDKESAHKISIPPGNNDISRKGGQFTDTSGFFREINKYARIYTDRLHIAVAACLLEKEVHLYKGSYFKNRAVYLSSMKGVYDNLHFHEHFDF